MAYSRCGLGTGLDFTRRLRETGFDVDGLVRARDRAAARGMLFDHDLMRHQAIHV